MVHKLGSFFRIFLNTSFLSLVFENDKDPSSFFSASLICLLIVTGRTLNKYIEASYHSNAFIILVVGDFANESLREIVTYINRVSLDNVGAKTQILNLAHLEE